MLIHCELILRSCLYSICLQIVGWRVTFTLYIQFALFLAAKLTHRTSYVQRQSALRFNSMMILEVLALLALKRGDLIAKLGFRQAEVTRTGLHFVDLRSKLVMGLKLILAAVLRLWWWQALVRLSIPWASSSTLLVVLIEYSNPAGWWILANLFFVNHHINARDVRCVHLIGRYFCQVGSAREEL